MNRRQAIRDGLKKIHSGNGMTIIEMLTTVLIFLIVSAGLVNGVSFGVRQFNKAMRETESQILASTLETVIGNELRYTKVYETGSSDSDVVAFYSKTYAVENAVDAAGCSKFVSVNEKGQSATYGELALQDAAGDEKKRILGSSAYHYGLGARVDSITFDQSTRYFTVSLTIAADGEEYATRTFQVKNLNNASPTS